MPGRTLARNQEVAYRWAVRLWLGLIVAIALPNGASAEELPSDEPVAPPKVAVVIAGDPDPSLRTAALEIELEALAAGLNVPTDPALRGALQGDPIADDADDDGLGSLRAMRRSLGASPRKDLASYRRLGTIAGADALLVLRREGTIQLEVFDVSAAQFYEGMLDVDQATPEERRRYIERRAKTAQARWDSTELVVTTVPTPSAVPEPKTAAINPPDTPEDESRAKRRIKKAWPYILVGALLVGGVTFLIVDGRRTNDPGPPLLSLRPGEEE